MIDRRAVKFFEAWLLSSSYGAGLKSLADKDALRLRNDRSSELDGLEGIQLLFIFLGLVIVPN